MPDYVGEITMRSGDQLPTLGVAIETDMGVAVDLTGATHVDFILTHEDGRDPRTGAPNPHVPQLVLPGTLVNAPAGIVGYDWQTADSLRPGVIEMVVVAYLPAGTISAPTDRTARIIVRPDPLDIFGGTVPGRYDLNLYRGDTKTWLFRLWGDDNKTVPVRLDDATAIAEIRNKPGGALVVALSCTVELPNVVYVNITADQANHIPASGVWDLELHYPSGDIQTAVNGSVTATPDVTGSLFSSIEEVSRV